MLRLTKRIANPGDDCRTRRGKAKFGTRNTKCEIRKWSLRLVRWACLVGYTLGNAEISEFDGSAAAVARPGCGKMGLLSS
jgi:hypothetical protein